MLILNGFSGSSFKGAGPVYRPASIAYASSGKPLATRVSPKNEQVLFQSAYSKVRQHLEKHVSRSTIFSAHLEILEDLKERIEKQILEGSRSAVEAVSYTCDEVSTLFSALQDEYLQSRSDDIIDLCGQLLDFLRGPRENPFLGIADGSVVLADNLLPSDTLLLDLSRLGGIALKGGSVTSHLAILARSQGVPLVLGVGEALDGIPEDAIVLVDGDTGTLIVHPTAALLTELINTSPVEQQRDTSVAITAGGRQVEVLANAGSVTDVEHALFIGADGIGLLRTEFIFMQGTDFPDEDTQYRIYLECARLCKGNPLTIRTLDIGADKHLPYHRMDIEQNPAFGLRGIRFSLANPVIFKVQLRAVLRASAEGNVRLMFPMISSVEEYQRACALLHTCKEELASEGKFFDKDLQPGVMIETPASVFLASELASIVSFFSIGTNDLTQYILAVDREYPYAEDAGDSFHPAVIKSLEHVVASAHQFGIKVSLCGEMASDPRATSLLLGLGIHSWSVTGLSIPGIKAQIRKQV